MPERAGQPRNVDRAAAPPERRISDTENDPPHPGVDQSARAHWTGFLGHENVEGIHPPVAGTPFQCAQKFNLRVAGHTAVLLDPVPGTRHDPAGTHRNRPDRHFTGCTRGLRLAERLAHEELQLLLRERLISRRC